jgi:hypothetical protein
MVDKMSLSLFDPSEGNELVQRVTSRIGIADVHDYEVSKLINRLVSFLGANKVERCIQKYHFSLQSSGPVFRDYYLKYRHPWWNALSEFFNLEKAGKSIRRNLTQELEILAGDAKKVTILQKLMPDSVREKCRKDLIDDNRAYDYLFEIDIAWHFFLKGYDIEWYEDSLYPHSEFLTRAPGFEFNVECKRISVDISRRIRRRDFYRLAEQLIPKIANMGFSGTIEIALSDKLHGNDDFLNQLASEVFNEVSNGRTRGSFQIALGSLILELVAATGSPVDLYDRFEHLWKRKSPQAHAAIFAKSKDGKPVDPVELTLMAKKADNVLDGIRDRIKKAKDQLNESTPGLIACFLEGVDDLRELAKDSGLQIISNVLLAKESFSHIAGISYSSEPRLEQNANSEKFFNQALIFRNPHCRYEKARDFQFLSGEQEAV